MRCLLIVLDSVGIGATPDAAEYGDEGADTLGHLAAAVESLNIPRLQLMGLGNIRDLLPLHPRLRHVPPVEKPLASYGAMRERSVGKDTTTGHWEIAGLYLEKGFHLFPKTRPCFPEELIRTFEERTGRKTIGNKHASGTVIIEELGPQQLADGSWIVYTSADSVFQIAAHKDVIPLEELYEGCRIARELCNDLRVGRVIARPYAGQPGSFKRTEERRDFSYPLPGETVMDRLTAAGVEVTTVGKLDDVFNHRGMTDAIHGESSEDAITATLDLLKSGREGLIFVNLIDFDMLYGHRRDPAGYARALETADRFLSKVMQMMEPDDLLIVTADHGNDPTFKGTDHTREYTPLLVYRPSEPGQSLGIRDGFYDIAQSIAGYFSIAPMPLGKSFLT